MANHLTPTNSCVAGHDGGHRHHRGGHHQGCNCGNDMDCGQHRHARKHGHFTSAQETPLSQIAAGTTVTVTGIQGDQRLRGRIMAMGIMPGASLSVLKSCGRRPLMVALAGSRVVLDRQTCHSITVRVPLPRAQERTDV